jgi:1,4-alpha-glucan branching enzyme
MAKREKKTTNENKDRTTGTGRNKKIDEKDLKMPTATGDKKPSGTKGSKTTSSRSSKPEGTSKKAQREEPGFSEQNESSFSGKETGSEFEGPTDSKGGKTRKKTGDTTAKEKEPSKITQPAKGRFSDELESSGSALGEKGKQTSATKKGSVAKEKKPAKNSAADKARAKDNATTGASAKKGISSTEEKKPKLPKPKKALPRNTASEEGTGNQTIGNAEKRKISSAKRTTSKKETGDASAKAKPSSAKSKKSTKTSPGPEVKGDEGRSKASSKKEKEKETETSPLDDLKNIAAKTAKGLADKYLPDEETRREISKTARDILPDQEEIMKKAQDLKNQLSPEIELAKKAVDKVIPDDHIKENAEKVKKTAKRVKNRNEEKAAENKFNEISLLSEYDIHLFREGKHFHLYKKLGSHLMEFNGNAGVYFALWAPNASQVSVIGDFNDWYKQAHPMKARPDSSGIWEVFIPEAKKGSLYKYFIKSNNGYEVEKGDPFAFYWETPPNTASVVWDLKNTWNDKKWLTKRKKEAGKAKPVSVYELHIGSWKRVPEDGMRSLSYRELAEQLPGYLKETGFTHVEFMPVMEHPFFGSWGYQITGYFAPSSRFGTPQDFMYLIDALHQAEIGVILDWVPSHFPNDLHGLHYFDGTFLFEHEDPNKGFHPDWQSYIFNYGRDEVRSFLISNALYWLDVFHADGLRVDAVASMLYLDYSRKEGEWEPNEYGGNEDLDAISFLKEFNEVVYAEFPDTMTIAEESTAWPMVSKPTYMGGLGFGMKWMMGWMHDTLEYFQKDPIHRKHHQNTITFSTTYAFTENFMLPLSHDEVVYGKQAILNKMPGDNWNKFANLRSLYSYMFAHPGTKLLFMGAEFGQPSEWNHDSSLEWHLLEEAPHREIKETIAQLNRLYKSEPALYEKSFEGEGFEWVDFQDAESSVISFLRKGIDPKDNILVVCNLTPVPRENYRIGVPQQGTWKEIFNSDDSALGGSNVKNHTEIKSEAVPTHHKEQSVSLTLPPMGVIYLKRG